jgi:hypothetical protein
MGIRHTQQLTVQRLIVQTDSLAVFRRHAPGRVRDMKNGDLGFGHDQTALVSKPGLILSNRCLGYCDANQHRGRHDAPE